MEKRSRNLDQSCHSETVHCRWQNSVSAYCERRTKRGGTPQGVLITHKSRHLHHGLDALIEKIVGIGSPSMCHIPSTSCFMNGKCWLMHPANSCRYSILSPVAASALTTSPSR